MGLPKKIGRYEVKEKLGIGGMGEVFLAHDAELGRDVAIKVLLPEFCCDVERVNRFKLEAKSASSLNHPNIITIYEIGSEGEQLFIVTEFIEGETLRSLIERKALDLSSTLNISEQIASALATSHQAGIIHRDIKPENIMIRGDGFVKVLDFGLAKPTIVESEAETRELVSTKAGVVMGSVAYMSPEQARGKEMDSRTDLWSLGVCTYEMLASKTPFDGETMTDILANIIHKDPVSIVEIVDEVPTELNRIIKKSLRKNRDERYQTAKDFSVDLKNLRKEMELEHELEVSISPSRFHELTSRSKEIYTNKTLAQKSADEVVGTQIMSSDFEANAIREIVKKPSSKQRVSMFYAAIIGILLLSGLAISSYFLWKKPALTTSFANASIEKLPISGKIQGLEFSPDGKYLAIVEGTPGAKIRLILRQFATGSEKDILPFEESSIMLVGFSPDSNYIYFRKNERGGLGSSLFRVAILGGEPKKIAFDVDSGVSFSPDGTQIVFHRHTINPSREDFIVINAEGGEEKVVFSSNEYASHPQFSPDGKIIVFAVYDKTIGFGKSSTRLAWIPSTGGTPTFIGNQYFSQIADYRWLQDGSGLISSAILDKESNYQVVTIAFPNGEISRITKDSNDYYGNSITADGKKVAVVLWNTISGIWEYDLATKSAKQIIPNSEDFKGYSGLATTPDGKIIFTKTEGKNDVDLWQMNADSSNIKPLLTGKGENRIRNVSSDGKTMFFESMRNGSQDIWKMNADGSNEVQLTKTSDSIESICGILPDNRTLIYKTQSLDNSKTTVEKIDVETGETAIIWQNEKVYLQSALLSPDGKNLLTVSAPINFETGVIPQTSLYSSSFDGTKLGEPKVVQKILTGSLFRFTPDSKSLLFIDINSNSSDITKLDIESNKTSKITNFNLETIFRFTQSPDGKKLYLVRGNMSKEAVLIKNDK
jgi:eukaryotic-like serine/threonine-protein kinase